MSILDYLFQPMTSDPELLKQYWEGVNKRKELKNKRREIIHNEHKHIHLHSNSFEEQQEQPKEKSSRKNLLTNKSKVTTK
jgi:poly(A) polymerase Pap1